MHPAANAASASILSQGYARVKLRADETVLLAAAIRETRSFFAMPAEGRIRHANREANLGFRPIGHEYPAAGRPDWNECFTMWADHVESIPHSEEISTLLSALLAWRLSVRPLVVDLLDNIRKYFDGHQIAVSPDNSFTQVNSYSLGSSDRDFLQDEHEDGYLLTVIHTTDRGLEISPSDGFTSVETKPCEVLIMPGAILGDVRGERIRGLSHRVRNLNLADRLSLMYFAGPDLSAPLLEWPGGDLVEDSDLRGDVLLRPNPIHLPVPEPSVNSDAHQCHNVGAATPSESQRRGADEFGSASTAALVVR